MLTKLSDKMRNDIWDRFWEKVDIGEPDECWLWKASCNANGYGQFGIHPGKTILAHRLAFLLAGKKTTSEKPYVLHKQYCTHRNCVNPSHLYAGNQLENMQDRKMVDHYSTQVKGEMNGNSKLTEQQILEIRFFWKTGMYTQTKLAFWYEVSQPLISYIVNNRNWIYLQETA